MIDFSWYVEDEDRDPDVAGAPRPIFGTWHFLRGALRREWPIWAGLATLGAMLGLAAVVAMPPPSTATATLLLAQRSGTDSETAMATDKELLETRTVAARVVDELGLAMSPEAFQSDVTAEQVSSQVLRVEVKGPDDRAAVARANALLAKYLAFRSATMRSLTQALVAGHETSIATLRKQVDALTAQYSRLSEQSEASERGPAILSERTQLNSQITTAQRAIEDATLQTEAAIIATQAIDMPSAVPHSARKAAALSVGSGLIVGAALGVGLVLFRGLTSERLWRRQEVALALDAPVRFSVGSKGPSHRRSSGVWQRLGAVTWHRGRYAPWRGHDLETLVHGLESAIVPATGWSRTSGAPSRRSRARKSVAITAVDNDAAAAAVIDALATRLRELGRSVFLVDLSASGALVGRIGPAADTDMEASGQAPVYRPVGVPGLARGPLGTAHGAISDLPTSDPLRACWDVSDVVLALVQVDPDLVVMNLKTWVGQVIPLVTAGRASAEHLEAVAEIIRAAGLDLPFAMMLGTDRTDRSLGVPERLGSPAETPGRGR